MLLLSLYAMTKNAFLENFDSRLWHAQLDSHLVEIQNWLLTRDVIRTFAVSIKSEGTRVDCRAGFE